MTHERKRIYCILGLILACAIASPAQDEAPLAGKVAFKALSNFPENFLAAGLAQGTDGNLYGTTLLGGSMNQGIAYRLTPAGTPTTIYNFCSLPNCADGGFPPLGQPLALGTDGNFYGTTLGGGGSGNGTIFKITTSGALTTLYNVCSQSNCTDGSSANGLTLGPDGNFYGTMLSGGAYNQGTVFQLTPEGVLNTIYSFCPQAGCPDGYAPLWPPVFGPDGSLYGTTGNNFGNGSIYKLTLGGKLTTLRSFDGTDGFNPDSVLVLARSGDLYGVTYGGGTGGGYGGVFFRISPSGAYTVLYNFCSLPNCADGDLPGTLVYGDDGNFYGANDVGGNTTTPPPPCSPAGDLGGCGTLFKITPEGALTTLHVFNGTTGGFGGLTLAQTTNGIFYGTDYYGGTDGNGAIFALSAGFAPFVQIVPASGKVGAAVQILGDNLTGATTVAFNGACAAFEVKSKTLITATVPAGATTALVEVTTSSGTLKSNVEFRITQ